MKKTYEITTRCKGEPCQYHTLRLMQNGEVVRVHTSKDMGYLRQMIPAGYVRN
jgi:hypothetical protein